MSAESDPMLLVSETSSVVSVPAALMTEPHPLALVVEAAVELELVDVGGIGPDVIGIGTDVVGIGAGVAGIGAGAVGVAAGPFELDVGVGELDGGGVGVGVFVEAVAGALMVVGVEDVGTEIASKASTHTQ